MLSRIVSVNLNGPNETEGRMEEQTMKPKRKSYNEEFYELDNHYNEDFNDRYQSMAGSFSWGY